MEALHKYEMHMQHEDSQHGMSIVSQSPLYTRKRLTDESLNELSGEYINDVDKSNLFRRRYNHNDKNIKI